MSKGSMIVPTLPPQPTPFIGRDTEVQEICDLLAEPACRLLMLIGPGGIGKTRLAMEAAGRSRTSFADGAVFIPLQPIASPDFLLTALADVLGLALSGQADPKAQLLNFLREKQLLLDNFEHLLE